MQNKKKPTYRVLPAVTPAEVPGWARRPPKWNDLMEQILPTETGQTLPIEFEDAAETNRARSTIRDSLSRETGKVALQTRVSTDPVTGKTTVYFTMLLEEDDKPKRKA